MEMVLQLGSKTNIKAKPNTISIQILLCIYLILYILETFSHVLYRSGLTVVCMEANTIINK